MSPWIWGTKITAIGCCRCVFMTCEGGKDMNQWQKHLHIPHAKRHAVPHTGKSTAMLFPWQLSQGITGSIFSLLCWIPTHYRLPFFSSVVWRQPWGEQNEDELWVSGLQRRDFISHVKRRCHLHLPDSFLWNHLPTELWVRDTYITPTYQVVWRESGAISINPISQILAAHIKGDLLWPFLQ